MAAGGKDVTVRGRMSGAVDKDEGDRAIAALLTRAERRGLRIAVAGRTIVLAGVTVWFAAFGAVAPAFALAFFALLGVLHYWLLRNDGYDRRWSYLFFALDIAAVLAVFVFVPLS